MVDRHKFHTGRGKGPESSQNTDQHAVVSGVSLAAESTLEWVLGASAEWRGGVPGEDGRAGNTAALVVTAGR